MNQPAIMKRLAALLVTIAAIAAFTTTAQADKPAGLTCGGHVGTLGAYYESGVWHENDYHFCGDGKTYSYEIQISTDNGNHWTDWSAEHVAASDAGCNAGCADQHGDSASQCSTGAGIDKYRIQAWWNDGSIRTNQLSAQQACLGIAFHSAASRVTPAAASPITHVILVAMENHSRSQVIGTTSAPYITSLARTYGEATNYTNILHPSLPNYMAVTGGTPAGITDDCSPSASCGSSSASIFSQMPTGWRAYNQAMPTPCAKTSSGPYAVKHNPAAYYRNLTNCSTRDVALPATPTAAAKLTFITPDLNHDMHDGSVAQGDAWLKSYMPKLMATAEYKAGTAAIMVWWDENSGSGTLPFVVVSPYTHGVTYTAPIDHYSTLRTLEALLGRACLGAACQRTSYAAAFGL